jgi:glyoxylase-like metal-dependent hydrolase (beta-lactamase superfamily II)
MRVVIVRVTPFVQNCSIVWCEKTKLAAVVDPGGDLDRIEQVMRKEGLTLEKILLTHAHIDHAGATAELARRAQVPIEGPHRDDQFWIDSLPEAGGRYGFQFAEVFTPNRWLQQGDTVTVGEEILQVRHCPGHTPGHVVFVHATQRFALVGDVLFQGSIGRTDFPRGNMQELIRSIRENLFPLGDDIHFVPGHGPVSTFGAERMGNPFVADRLFKINH